MRVIFTDKGTGEKFEKTIDWKGREDKLENLIRQLLDIGEDEADLGLEDTREKEIEEIREAYISFVEKAAMFAYKYNVDPSEVYDEVVKSPATLESVLRSALKSKTE